MLTAIRRTVAAFWKGVCVILSWPPDQPTEVILPVGDVPFPYGACEDYERLRPNLLNAVVAARTTSGMSNLQRHIEEISKTLAPEYGPESPSEAVDRLLEYYQKLSPVDHVGFVAALIGEVVTLKVMQRSMQKREA